MWPAFGWQAEREVRREREAGVSLQRDADGLQERLQSARAAMQSLSEAQEAMRAKGAQSDAAAEEAQRVALRASAEAAELRLAVEEARGVARQASASSEAAAAEAEQLRANLREAVEAAHAHESWQRELVASEQDARAELSRFRQHDEELRRECAGVQETLAAQRAAAEATGQTVQEQELALEHARGELEEAAAYAALLKAELERSEAQAASEAHMNEQLAQGLQVLKASHQEALGVPDALQRNYQETLHAMVEQHEEQRQRWAEERAQLLAGAHQARDQLAAQEESSARWGREATDALAQRAGALRDEVRQLRLHARSELQQHWRDVEQSVRQLRLEAYRALTTEEASAAQLRSRLRDTAEAKAGAEDEGRQTARALIAARDELSSARCRVEALEADLEDERRRHAELQRGLDEAGAQLASATREHLGREESAAEAALLREEVARLGAELTAARAAGDHAAEVARMIGMESELLNAEQLDEGISAGTDALGWLGDAIVEARRKAAAAAGAAAAEVAERAAVERREAVTGSAHDVWGATAEAARGEFSCSLLAMRAAMRAEVAELEERAGEQAVAMSAAEAKVERYREAAVQAQADMQAAHPRQRVCGAGGGVMPWQTPCTLPPRRPRLRAACSAHRACGHPLSRPPPHTAPP